MLWILFFDIRVKAEVLKGLLYGLIIIYYLNVYQGLIRHVPFIYYHWVSSIIYLALGHVIALIIATFSKRRGETFLQIILDRRRWQKGKGKQPIRVLLHSKDLALIGLIHKWSFNQWGLVAMRIESDHFTVHLNRCRFFRSSNAAWV